MAAKKKTTCECDTEMHEGRPVCGNAPCYAAFVAPILEAEAHEHEGAKDDDAPKTVVELKLRERAVERERALAEAERAQAKEE